MACRQLIEYLQQHKPEQNNIVLYITKIEECFHRTQMSPLPAIVNRGITTERKKVSRSEIELGLPFMASDIAHNIVI